MSKKPSKPQNPKITIPAYRHKVILHTRNDHWWSDLRGTVPEEGPSWHENNGWEIVEDDPVDNDDYPEIDRRVKLRQPDTSGTEPIGYIDMF
jgi:hypothetical protein